MALMKIYTAPDPVLKKVALPVPEVDADIIQLMDDMLETMYAANGIGLAAPQVGISQRVIVVDVSENRDTPICMVNPELAWLSDEDNRYQEGCLSLPTHYADVVRPEAIKLQYLDKENKQQELSADGLLATCIQHEIDHLDGVLFVDHISSLKRTMIMRKLVKAKKAQAV